MMSGNFSKRVNFDNKTALAVVIPQFRKDGMYYEVNIKGYPRFYMKWTSLDRYDITTPDVKLPYALILAVSDAIEEEVNAA